MARPLPKEAMNEPIDKPSLVWASPPPAARTLSNDVGFVETEEATDEADMALSENAGFQEESKII